MKDFKQLNLLLICVLSGLFANHLYAQERGVVRQRIEIKQAGDEEEETTEFYMAAGVTVDPMRLITGALPITMQFAPTEWLVLEAGSGLTVRKNYIMELIHDDYYPEDARVESNMNPMLVLGVKLFPDGDVFYDGTYLGVEYRYRNYSNDLYFEPELSEPYMITKNLILKDLSVMAGYHYETTVPNLFLDYYLGVSLRQVQSDRVTSDVDINGIRSPYYLETEENETFGFLLGIKIGYYFEI